MTQSRVYEKPIHHRRRFIQQISAGLALAVAHPVISEANTKYNNPLEFLKKLPPDEKYWEMVKQQFAVPSNLMMVNSANLCPSPYFVIEKVIQHSKNLAKDVSFQNRAKFKENRKKTIEMLASYLGVQKEEVGITRNTSESNNIVVNGFDFGKGDEIIIWDQNHPTNNLAWKQKAKRHGFTVKTIKLPSTPQNKEELISPFSRAITPKTRLIAFSHISNVSGIALPVKEICSLAKEKGIYTLIDGAQAFGFLDLNITDIGCDFYSGSAHKWLMGALENGILYVKKDVMESIWPSIVGAGWTEEYQSTDEKFCVLGQRNNATTASLIDIIEFHQTIGKKNVENRVRELNAYLKKQISKKLPQATFVTPQSSDLSGGIVIFKLPGKEPAEVYQKLYENYGIAGAPTGGIRLSPNIHNTLKDMDRIVEALVVLA